MTVNLWYWECRLELVCIEVIGVEDVVVFFKLVILVEVGANNLVIGRGFMIFL